MIIEPGLIVVEEPEYVGSVPVSSFTLKLFMVASPLIATVVPELNVTN